MENEKVKVEISFTRKKKSSGLIIMLTEEKKKKHFHSLIRFRSKEKIG